MKPVQLPFITLILLFSFAPVNAVLFTPALPDITRFFNISATTAQYTISFFLIGYSLGQLIYGPVANRFGRKSALFGGVGLQIIGSLLCILAGVLNKYSLLLCGRFLLALGSGVGLNMTITLVSECYEAITVSQTISYLLLTSSLMPGLSVALGGFLNKYYGWISCFYASAIYGLILLLLIFRLPETLKIKNLNALKIQHLVRGYCMPFKNIRIISSGLFMGLNACFVYIFAALAPFIAIRYFGMTSMQYGIANLLPPIGILLGSLCSALFAKIYPPKLTIRLGILIAISGSLIMLLTLFLNLSVWISLFLPMIIIYFGMMLIPAHASTIAMSSITDKANGSAVMNFICVSIATLVILNVGFLPIKTLLLPLIYLAVSMGLAAVYYWGIRS